MQVGLVKSCARGRRVAILKRREFMVSKNGKPDKAEEKVEDTPRAVDDILRGSAHALTVFKPGAVDELEIFMKRGKPYLKCCVSGKDRPAKPEEIVRQLYAKMLMEDYGYPAERIFLEKPVQFGSAVHEKAADIVVSDKDASDTAFIIVECKKPRRADGLEQLKSYCHAEGAPIDRKSTRLNSSHRCISYAVFC